MAASPAIKKVLRLVEKVATTEATVLITGDTGVGKEMYEKFGISEMEVTEEVFESPAGVQFEQAENRLHTIKAILVATLGD